MVDADISQTLAIVPYARGKEFDESLKDAKSAISRALQGNNKPQRLLTPPGSPSPMASAAKPREFRTWRSSSGTEIKASLVRQAGGFVELQKDDGGMVKIRPMQLSAEDQAYLDAQ